MSKRTKKHFSLYSPIIGYVYDDGGQMQQWLSENGGAVSSGISGFASGIDSMEYSDAANNGFSTVDSLITGGTKTKLGMELSMLVLGL